MGNEKSSKLAEIETQNIAYIRQWVKSDKLYLHLAEECVKLAKVAMEMYYEAQKTEPDILALRERQARLIAEHADVMVCSRVIGIPIDKEAYNYKLNTWAKDVSEGDFQ